MHTTRQASMGSSDDVIPVTMGFVDDIQQLVAALSSVSLHWKLQECVGGISVGLYGADVSPVYWMSQWRRMTQGCGSHVASSRM